MNILIDASAAYQYHSTGIGAYATELLNALRTLPIAEQISVFDGSSIRPLNTEDRRKAETRCDFWEQAAENPRGNARGFDLYHNLHNGIGMKAGSKKTLITVHDMIPLIYPSYCGASYRERFQKEVSAAMEKADGILTVSENSKADILRFTTVAAERIHVIPEAPKHHCKPLPAEECADYLFARYHVKPPFFLYVGGFNPRKNVAGLLRGYAAVYRRFPRPCPLVIIGRDGSRRRELEALSKSLHIDGLTYFCGDVPEEALPYFYNLCYGLIYPSFYEGFGLPPLEAAACAAPVITTKGSSLREVMGDAALYIDAHSPQSIGAGLLQLLQKEELRHTMAERAYHRSRLFSYKKTAQKTAALYEKICR